MGLLGKTVLLSLVYNEEILLPHFLQHYRHYVDKFVFFDGGSDDRTLEIIETEPGDIEINNFSVENADDENFLKMKNEFWKKYRDVYDWVIIVDVDEFLIFPEKLTGTIIKPVGFDIVDTRQPTINDELLDEFTYGVRNELEDKCCMFSMKDIQEINYEPGAHKCNPKGNIIYQPSTLLHYRYLGLTNVLGRTALNGLRLSEQNIQRGWGYHNLQSAKEKKEYFDKLMKERINLKDKFYD